MVSNIDFDSMLEEMDAGCSVVSRHHDSDVAPTQQLQQEQGCR